MKQLLMKILKVFLIVAAIALGIFLVAGIVLALDWPWWMGVVLAAGLAGLGIGCLFLRKIWLNRREQRFVQQIIEQDKASLKTLDGNKKEQSQELQKRWKEAIVALKHSHLKRLGNPLYVLPWYMVIGESGSGKTTALQSARLSSPFAEVSRTSGISGTRNCDWWFFEQAIILDTAGRYVIPVDEDRDRDEWQKFLNLLGKYRKREPVNGLIITIAADKLLEAGAETLKAETLEKDGQAIRRRLDELMGVMGVKVPVYILVTKCDLIQGMTQFCAHLPEQNLDQAMGFINHDLLKDVDGFQNQAFEAIGERLRDLRLVLVNKTESRVIDPSLLLFPEEFERLKPGLDIFIKRIFQKNPYQETHILRGLFFSSGRQEGTPYSHFLQAMNLIAEKDALPVTNKGLFLHDFFSRILPKERSLFTPTQRAVEFRHMTRSLGLTSWVVLLVAVCGLMSFSFMMNTKTLRSVHREFSDSSYWPPGGKSSIDLPTLDRFRRSVLKVESWNRNWWVPAFGLHESKGVETGLKDKYCRKFEKFLNPLDERMTDKIAGLSIPIPDTIIRQQVDHLVRRIHLLEARLDGQDFEDLKAKPQPAYASVTDQEVVPEVESTFDSLYIYYLVWRTDSEDIKQEIKSLQQLLESLLTLKGTNLHWLASWVNENSTPVTLKDFWGGNPDGGNPDKDKTTRGDQTTQDDRVLPALTVQGDQVLPAFTVKGKEQIDSFLKEIESALSDPLIMASQKMEFNRWYNQAYVKAWYDFGVAFPKGAERLITKEERRQTADRMAAGQGPYIAFLDKMDLELKALAGEEKVTSWPATIHQFQDIKGQATWGAQDEVKNILTKVTDKGKRLMSTMEKKISQVKGMSPESQLNAAQAYLEYQNALGELSLSLSSGNLTCQAAAQAFGEEPAIGKSPFFSAQRAISKLKTSLAGGGTTDEMFWKLVTGPIDYLWSFIISETGSHLQKQWEEEVLTEIQGISGWERAQQIIWGPEGYVEKFVKGKLDPFISRSQRKGYHAKEVLGSQIPFNDAFFDFLNRGTTAIKTIKPNYSVTIKGLPTDTNPGGLNPQSTKLDLYCTDCIHDTQEMENFNFPVERVFKWCPSGCNEVVFQIAVAELTLTKKYSGDLAFPRFLEDFRGGERIFSIDEFPEENVILKRFGIKHIKVRYQFSGHQPVLDLSRVVPTNIPQKIVH